MNVYNLTFLNEFWVNEEVLDAVKFAIEFDDSCWITIEKGHGIPDGGYPVEIANAPDTWKLN